MSDQTVRLVFLGEAGAALRATDTVTTGVKRLSAAEKEQAATSRQMRTETASSRREFQGLEKDIGKASRGALAGSGLFRALGRSVAFASASFLGGYGLLAVVNSSVKELEDSAAANALLKKRLVDTGGAAGVTAKQLDVLATATFRKTSYDTNQVKAAESVLLTFTQVRDELGKGNDVYTRAISVSADLARALGTDLPSAAQTLGKALNDPTIGLTSLTRQTGAFTKAQRDEIVAFAASGEVTKAQTMILDGLEQKIGGVADAYGKTVPGQIEIFRGELRLLEGELATALLPDIIKLVDAGTKWARKLEEDKGAQQEFRHDVEQVVGALGDVFHVLHEASDATGGLKSTLELLIALKVAGWARETAGGLAVLTGAEAASGGTGLAGAASKSEILLANLTKLAKIGSVVIGIDLLIRSHGKPGVVAAFESVAGGALLGARVGGVPGAIAGAGVGLGLAFHNNPGSASANFADKPGDLSRQPTADMQRFIVDWLNQNAPGTNVGALGGIRGVVQHFPALAKALKQQYGTAGLATGPGPNGFTTGQVRAAGSSFANVPYQWGGGHAIAPGPSFASGHGTAQLGLDCSGYARAVLANLGITVNGTADQLLHQAKSHPSVVQLQPGDLVFYEGIHPNHVMVYIGNGQVIGETHTGARGPEVKPVNYLPITGTGRYTPTEKTGGGGGGGTTPPRTGTTPPRPQTGATKLQTLNLALAKAGTTTGTGDDRTALENLIAYYRQQVAKPGVPVTTQTQDYLTLGGYISQLAGLDKNAKPGGKASASSLLVIKNTLASVSKLVDQAGLDKKFGGQLSKLNDEIDKKFVTAATVTKVRLQLAKIAAAAKAAIDQAKKDVQAKKQGFVAAWTSLADAAMAAFDQETQDHVGPTRAILNALTAQHDQDQVDQAVTDAKKALDEALAGQNTATDSDIVSQIQQLVGNTVLANAIDKAQSDILGGTAAPVSSDNLLAQLQQILGGQGGAVVDPQAVADAQQAYNDALYQQKVFYLGKQADAEDAAYSDERAKLRDALSASLDAWGTYYANIGAGARDAASDFASVWSQVLAEFPIAVGGTGQNPSGAADAAAQAQREVFASAGYSAGFLNRAGIGFGGAFASGGEGVVTRPTLFLAGEAGAEHFRFTPVGGSSSTGTPTAHVHLSLGDGLEQLIDAKIVQATPGLTLSIGRQADRLRRGGRI